MGQIEDFMMNAIGVKTVFAGAIIYINFTYPLAMQYHTMYARGILDWWEPSKLLPSFSKS